MTNTTAALTAMFEKKFDGLFNGNLLHEFAAELAASVVAEGFALRSETLLEAAAAASHIYGATDDAKHQAEQTERALTLMAAGPSKRSTLVEFEATSGLESTNELGDGRVHFRTDESHAMLADVYDDDENPGDVTATYRVTVIATPVN